MLTTKQLISNLKYKCIDIKVKKEDSFNFNNKKKAYVLLSGRVISYGERDYTQLLKNNDPIGFAESILAKEKILKYKRLTDIVLLEFNSKEIRDAVNKSNIAVKAIIKYSLDRIFSVSKTNRNSHYLFEEEFVYKNWKLLDTKTYNEEAIIFSHGNLANNMFFIEKGKVRLISNEDKLIKILHSGESFGELALLRGRRRYNSAISIGHTILKVIKGSMISKLIDNENSLVQLSILSLAKKLEIMNGIRSIDHHNKLKQEGLLV
jgi:CRP-like cAMP-binding protein